MKRALLSLSSIVAIAGALLLAGAPAQAAQGDCDNNKYCSWINSGYSGPIWESSVHAVVPAAWNNQISSTCNKKIYFVSWYSEPAFSGAEFVQVNGNCASFTWPDWRNDVFSSAYIH